MKLKLESITKFYGKYPALQNVSATLTEGVYGLLGPNGAGKTTLINILIGILPASGGVIYLDSENTVQMGGRYFDQIGYMPQYPQFYANFTVQEFLDYMCQVKGVANAKESIDAALVFVNLEENRSKRIGALSGGMRQRLGIAQAILNDPKLLVLDEPTASCIYTQKGNKKIRKPQAANQTALIFDRRAAARLLSINSIRRLCWS